MSFTPTTVPSLPSATSVSDSDYMLVNSGGLDKKCTAQQARAINIAGYPTLSSPSASDYLAISSGGSLYKSRFDAVGFVAGTTCYFYQNTAPSGWNIVTGVSDGLLAVKSDSGEYQTAGVEGGTWQQEDHTLTAAEMQHYHPAFFGSNETVANSGGTGNDSYAYKIGGGFASIRGGLIDQSFVTATGHNHGDSWRPKAFVGILCYKAS